MGNVKSFCCKDNASDLDDQEERSRILNANNNNNCDEFYSNNNNDSIASNEHSTQDSLSYGSTIDNGNKSMEQSILDGIYRKMAANVIDVAPGDSMIIQQAEFIERKKAYQAKLNQLKTPLPLKITHQLPSKHVSNSFEIKLPTSSPSSASTNSTTLAIHNSTCPNLNSPYNSNQTHLSPNALLHHRLHEKRRIEYEPISDEEIQLIEDISLRSLEAIKNLKINFDGDVVAPFKP